MATVSILGPSGPWLIGARRVSTHHTSTDPLHFPCCPSVGLAPPAVGLTSLAITVASLFQATAFLSALVATAALLLSLIAAVALISALWPAAVVLYASAAAAALFAPFAPAAGLLGRHFDRPHDGRHLPTGRCHLPPQAAQLCRDRIAGAATATAA